MADVNGQTQAALAPTDDLFDDPVKHESIRKSEPQYDPNYTPYTYPEGKTIWENTKTGQATPNRPVVAGTDVTNSTPATAAPATAPVAVADPDNLFADPKEFESFKTSSAPPKIAQDNITPPPDIGKNPVLPVADTAPAPVKNDEVSNPNAIGLLKRADIGWSGNFEAKAEKFQKYFGQNGGELTQKFEAADPKSPDKTEPVLYYTLKAGDPPTRFSMSTGAALQEYGRTLLKQLQAWNYSEDNLNMSPDEQDQVDARQKNLEASIEQGYHNVLTHMYADNSGNLPPAVGMAAATGGAGTLGLFLRIAAGTAGNVAGEGVNLASDAGRGYTVTNPDGQLEHAGIDGAAAMLAGETFAKMARIVMGEGLVKLSDGARQLLQDARSLNLPMPMPQQVLDTWQGLKRLMNQVGGMDSAIGQYKTMQDQMAYKKLRDLSPIRTDARGDFIPGSTSYEDIKPKLQDSWTNYLKTLKAKFYEPTMPASNISTKDPVPPFRVAGMNVDAGIEEYSNRSQTLVNQLYEKARGIEEPEFNFVPVVQSAQAAERGILAVEKPIVGPSTVLGADGSPMGDVTNLGRQNMRNIADKPSADVQAVLDDIQAIDPANMSVDTINTLRSRLFQFTQPNAVGRFDTAQAAADARVAKPVYAALNRVMDNPTNANPEFVKAWREASTSARERFENLEMAKVMQIAKSGEGDIATTLESLAQTLTTSASRQWSNVQQLKKILSPTRFQSLVDAVDLNLRSDPTAMFRKVTTLDRDVETRKMFFTDHYWNNQIKPLAQIYDGMAKTNIPAVLDAQNNASQIIDGLLKPGTGGSISTAGVDKIFEIVGGRDSEAGRAIRAGIIDKLLDASMKQVQDYGVLKGDKLTGLLRSAEHKNLTQFLTPEDITNFKAVAYYLRWTQVGGADMGSSLESASEFARLRHFEPEAIGAFVKSHLIAKFMTSKWGERMFYGTADAPRFSSKFMVAAAAFMGELYGRDRYKESNSPTLIDQTTKLIRGK